jgi:tetratricopeptide (TPR) repeat protein
VQLLREQARAALKEKDLEKSLSYLMRAKKVAPHDAELEYEFGIVALRMSLYEDARLAFEQVLTSRPTDANSIYALGRAQMGLGKIPATRELFERYVQLRPQDPTGHFGLGLVLRMLEMTEAARTQFERSIELQPDQTEAYVQLGFLDLDGGELDQSANRFQSALERAPQNAGALLGIGRIRFQRKDYAKAADFLLAALAADSSIREAHYYLGLTYARLGKTRESAEQMEIASQLEREDLDRHRIILKLLDPAEAQAIEKANP